MVSAQSFSLIFFSIYRHVVMTYEEYITIYSGPYLQKLSPGAI